MSVDKFGHANIPASSDRWNALVRQIANNLISARALSLDSLQGEHYDAGSKRISNLSDPSDSRDAIPRAWFEEKLEEKYSYLEKELTNIRQMFQILTKTGATFGSDTAPGSKPTLIVLPTTTTTTTTSATT